MPEETPQPIHSSAINFLANFPLFGISDLNEKTVSLIQTYAELGEDLPKKYLPSPIPAQLPAGFGTLITLPPELRHKIYRMLIPIGHINVLRTSQAIHDEGSEFLFKDGVYRTAFGYKWRPREMRPTRTLTRDIQRLRLSVYNKYSWAAQDLGDEFDVLKYFGGAGIYRKTCRVSFEVYPTTAVMVVRQILKILASFVGFEEVIIEWRLLGVQDTMKYKTATLNKCERPRITIGRTPEQVLWRIAAGIWLADSILEPVFGKGEVC